MQNERVQPPRLPINERRDVLISDGVACNGGEVFVPVPLRGVQISDHTDSFVRADKFLLLIASTCSCERLCVARSNDQNVTGLEPNALVFGNFLDVLHGNLMCFERAVLDAILIGPSLVVNQNATSNKTAPGMPMVERRIEAVFVFVAECLCQVVLPRLSVVNLVTSSDLPA